MRYQTLGLILGVVSMALATPAAPAQPVPNQPGQIRTSTGIPMRTGFGQPIRTTAGNYNRLTQGTGLYPGNYYYPAYTTGTSLSVSGDGYSINLNGSLAQQIGLNSLLGSNHGFGSTCLAVSDANDILPNLPAHVRDRTTVLLGKDYGWNYDVICFPSGGNIYTGYGSYGYGWYPAGNVYYAAGRSNINNPTAGWTSLGGPATTQQAPQQPVTPPEAIDIARVALVLGELESAEEQYRIHLQDNPEDSDALREFALVMFESDRVQDGFAALRKAYRDDPQLATRPLNLRDMGFDGSRTRRLMAKVSPVANTLKTSSGWLALAALLQWQDKDRAAIRMLDRAETMGLEAEIVAPLRTDLTS